MWVVTVVHVCVGVWFLLLGLLSSGRTREELVSYWSGANTCGRVCHIMVRTDFSVLGLSKVLIYEPYAI